MRFVVPIPLWIYLTYALVAISVGATALYIALVIFLIYMLITQPRQIIGFFLGIAVLSAMFQHWKATLLVLLFALIAKYLFRNRADTPVQKLLDSGGADPNQNGS